MRVGTLRHKITIQALQETPDGQGGVTSTWINVYNNIWASIITHRESRPTQMEDFKVGQQRESEQTHVVRIRYRDGVAPGMRVVWQSRTFRVMGVVIPSEVKFELGLLCQEVFNEPAS